MKKKAYLAHLTSLVHSKPLKIVSFYLFLVVSKNLLEPVAQVVEVNVLAHLRLKDAWLDLSSGSRALESLVKTIATRLILKEVAGGGSTVEHIQGWCVIFHSRL